MPQRPVEEIARETVFPREMTKEVIKDYHSYLIRSFAAALAAEREQFREASVLVDLEGESVGWAPVHAIPLLAKALRDAAEDTKRLDWLSSRGREMTTTSERGFLFEEGYADKSPDDTWNVGVNREGWHRRKSLREAIDAAMTPASKAEK